MLPSGECSFYIFRLTHDRERENNGVDVIAKEEVVVGLSRTRIIGVEIDICFEGFGRFEGARVDGFEGEEGAGVYRGQMLLADEDSAADYCYADRHLKAGVAKYGGAVERTRVTYVGVVD
jgi:hypothetical protein